MGNALKAENKNEVIVFDLSLNSDTERYKEPGGGRALAGIGGPH